MLPLGLTAASSATDAAIEKKTFGSGTTTLIFSNEYFNNFMKIVNSLENAALLIKGISETVENEVKEQKGGFVDVLAATLGAISLGNMLAGKGVIRAGKRTI